MHLLFALFDLSIIFGCYQEHPCCVILQQPLLILSFYTLARWAMNRS